MNIEMDNRCLASTSPTHSALEMQAHGILSQQIYLVLRQFSGSIKIEDIQFPKAQRHKG